MILVITLKIVTIFVTIIKKYLVKWKVNEYGAIPIDEFKGLRSKMYSIRGVNRNKKKYT